MENADRPSALALTRQNLPVLDRQEYASAEGAVKGGYVLAEAEGWDAARVEHEVADYHVWLERLAVPGRAPAPTPGDSGVPASESAGDRR